MYEECGVEREVNGWVCVCFLEKGHEDEHSYMMDRPIKGYVYRGRADMRVEKE